jgi:hypothetical protein
MDYLDPRAEGMVRTRFQLSHEFSYSVIQMNLLEAHERKVRRHLSAYNVFPSTDTHTDSNGVS